MSFLMRESNGARNYAFVTSFDRGNSPWGDALKIAFISQPGTVASPPKGGNSIGLWTYEIARRLAPTHDVIVFGGKQRRQKKPSEYHQGVMYRSVFAASVDRKLAKPLRSIYRLKRLDPKRPFFASQLYFLGYIGQIALELRKQRCNIVHVHNYTQFVPVIRAVNPKVKIVLHMHGEWLTQLDGKMIKHRLIQTDLIVGCSDYITEKIRHRFPQFNDRCQTIVNGVDVDRFTPLPDRKRIREKEEKRLLFVGRVSPEKGLHVLLDAFPGVADHFPQARLDIVGPIGSCSKDVIVSLSDDPQVKALSAFYRNNYLYQLQQRIPAQLRQRITFKGGIPHAELAAEHYRNADIVVNPSLSEASGISLLEAMSAEIPVIGTRTGGMTVNVDEGRTGLLVKPGNHEALAKAIVRLLSDDSLRIEMGKAGRRRVLDHFAWEHVIENLLHRYYNL